MCETVRVVALLVLVAVCHDTLWGQQPPYDSPPPAESPHYYRVRYDASSQPGELIFPVTYTAWIPPGVEMLRGVVVHQHGCGEGSCKSGQTGAFDLHWQALARKHDCALLAPSYEQPEVADCQMWCDPRNGSDTTFQRSLADLGTKSGHGELSEIPWALWGHSGGGHWVGGMLLLHPERVVAAWLRSGVPLLEHVEGRSIRPHRLPEAALEVPVMCNLGTKEGVTDKESRFAAVWPANQAFFHPMRSAGALIAVAVDPLTSHECGDQRYLAIPWFDACLTARLPEKTGEPLKPMPPQSGWIAPLPSSESQVVAASTGRRVFGRAVRVHLASQPRDCQGVDSVCDRHGRDRCDATACANQCPTRRQRADVGSESGFGERNQAFCHRVRWPFSCDRPRPAQELLGPAALSRTPVQRHARTALGTNALHR